MTCETDRPAAVTTDTAPKTATTPPKTEASTNHSPVPTFGEKTHNKRLQRKTRQGLPLRSLPDTNHQ